MGHSRRGNVVWTHIQLLNPFGLFFDNSYPRSSCALKYFTINIITNSFYHSLFDTCRRNSKYCIVVLHSTVEHSCICRYLPRPDWPQKKSNRNGLIWLPSTIIGESSHVNILMVVRIVLDKPCVYLQVIPKATYHNHYEIKIPETSSFDQPDHRGSVVKQINRADQLRCP